MRKVVIALLVFLFLPLISSEIIINQQPNTVYNFGDVITLNLTVKSLQLVSGSLYADLICDRKIQNFYKNSVLLNAGDEKQIETSLVLSKIIVGDLKGNCKVKAFLGADYSLTNEFKVSDVIKIDTTFKTL